MIGLILFSFGFVAISTFGQIDCAVWNDTMIWDEEINNIEEYVLMEQENLDLSAIEMDILKMYLSDDMGAETHSNGCQCRKQSCQCCAKLKSNIPQLKAEFCVVVGYSPKDLSAEVKLTVGGKTIFSKKISVKDPKPICVKVPIFKLTDKLCLGLENLAVDQHALSGCAKLAVKISKLHTKKDLKLGCFKVPFAV